MKNFRYALLLLLAAIGAASCNRPESSYQPPISTGNSFGVPASAATPTPAASENQGLTNGKVETAVADLLSDWRLGGSVSVKGIQELPQQNSAIADLQFEEFTYPVTYEGNLLKVKDFKPKKPSGALIPSPEEMFPPRKAVYSKDGKATLAHYSDGRWVLKGVRWGFDSGVNGSVEIR